MKKIIIGVICVILVLSVSIYWYISRAYVLEISVSRTTFNQGEDIYLTMVFENNSGRELQIGHGAFVAHYYVVDHDYYNGARHVPCVMSTVPKGKSVLAVPMGRMLQKGRYELVAFAELGHKTITSNTIILTVE